MSLPRYPKYKDSGIGRLGEVPAHWDVVPNKSFMSRRQALVGHQWRDTQLLSLTLRGVIHRDIDSGHGKYPADFGTYQEVAPGDLVFCLFDMDETPRTVGLSATRGMITGAYDVFRCEAHALPSYVTYYYLHVDSFKGLRPFYTGLRKVVRPPTFMAINIPLPGLPEQAAIAAFLDRETAKIDALVAEQERLIELLKEKRQAVISHAVTKGLNPDAPMKDSGVEWVGSVPAHWRCVRNKVVFAELDERSESDAGELLTVSHISGVTLRSEKDVNMFLAETLEGYKMCRAGDLVINTMWAWMGALGCSSRDGLVSPSYNVYRPRNPNELNPVYYDYLGRLPTHKVIMKARSSGVWESRLRLYPDSFLDMRMPLPPRAEQDAIVEFLSAGTRKWDALVVEAERSVDLLQERRKALISAAVTGQIDVRSAAERMSA